MDPTTTLRRIRELTELILAGRGSSYLTPADEDAVDLAEHIDALDDWLCKGGFLPVQWRMPPTRS